MKKTPLFAAAVFLLLAATYYLEFYQTTQEERAKQDSAMIVRFPVDEIHEFTLENKTGKIVLKRDTEGWRLVEPFRDWADNSFVDEFISGLVLEKSLDVASQGNAVSWSVYGLDKGTSKMAFTNQQGHKVQIEVSEKKNFEGNSFLRRDQENKVLVGSAVWLNKSQLRALDFRDKRLFRGKISAADEIRIKSKTDQFKLIHKVSAGDTQWVMEKKPELSLDQNQVRELLTSLNEIQATEYLDSLPADAKEVSEVGLKLGDKNWSTKLRQTPDKTIFAQTSDQFQLKLAPGKVGKFFDLSINSLRNRKEPFEFKVQDVEKIELQTSLKKTILVKVNNSWKVSGDEAAVLDAPAIQSYLSKLSSSSISEYLTPAEMAKFQKPPHKMVLKDKTDKTLLALTWGATLTRTTADGTKTWVMAKSQNSPEVFGLENSVIESWGLANIFPLEQPVTSKKEVK